MVQPECDKESSPVSSKGKEEEEAITEAVSRVVARMHGIEAGPTPLGPVLTSKVQVDGATTKALLDTGSPVNIISLDFVLQAASAGRSKDQSPGNWGKEVCKCFQPTTVSLRSYGGAELPIVAQISCQLSRRGFSVESVLQVQKGAPVDLLLGTDTLPLLGFSLTEKTDNATGTEDILHTGAATLQPTSTETAEVKLIRPARLPVGHTKLLRVKTSSPRVSGKTNARSDALSCYPVPIVSKNCANSQTPALIVAMEAPLSRGQSGEAVPEKAVLGERQHGDPHLQEIILYLENGELPADDRQARQVLLGQSDFTILDGILYRVEKDKTLRVVPLKDDRHQLYLEVHDGVFSGHRQQVEVHRELSRHYWWPGMRKDIDTWCRACLKCATKNVRKTTDPQMNTNRPTKYPPVRRRAGRLHPQNTCLRMIEAQSGEM